MIWSEPSNQIQPNNTHEQCVKIVSCSSTGCLIGILVPGVPNHYNGSPIPIFYINHPEMLFLLPTYLKRQRRCFTKKHNSKSNSFILSASQWQESHFKNSWTISYISISQHRNIESTIIAQKNPQIQIKKQPWPFCSLLKPISTLGTPNKGISGSRTSIARLKDWSNTPLIHLYSLHLFLRIIRLKPACTKFSGIFGGEVFLLTSEWEISKAAFQPWSTR